MKVTLGWEKRTCNEDGGLEKLEIGVAEAGSGGGASVSRIATNWIIFRGTLRAERSEIQLDATTKGGGRGWIGR